MEDAARDLRDLREDMDYDGEEAERVESRLDLLRRLNRKYGATTQEMIRYRDKIEAELSEWRIPTRRRNGWKRITAR